MGQKQNPVIIFDKDGKLQINKKLTSTSPLSSTMEIDISQVNQPSSIYFKSLSALVGKMQSLTGTPASANACLPQSLTATLPINSITAITGQSTNKFLVSDTTQHYLPLRLATAPVSLTAPTILTVVSSATISNSPFSLSVLNQPTDFQLIRQNYDNQILVNQLTNSIQHYKGWSAASAQLIDSLRTVFDRHSPRISTILFRDSLNVSVCASCQPVYHPFQISLIDEFTLFYNAFARTNSLYNKVLCDNSEWIKRWLWYTGGNIKLNPFDYSDPVPLIQQADTQLQQLDKRLALLQLNSTCCDTKSLSYAESAAKVDTLVQQMNIIKQQKERFTKLVDTYQKWLSDRSVESVVLYKGIIPPIDTREHINWQHHYDAADKFNFVTPKNQLPDMVADIDQVIVLTHNVKAGDSLFLKSIDTLFVPKTKFQMGLEPIAQALTTAVGFTSPIKAIAGVMASNFSSQNRKAPDVYLADIEKSAYESVNSLYSVTPKTNLRELERGDKLVDIKDTLSKTTYEQSQILIPAILVYIGGLRGVKAAQLKAKLNKLLAAPNSAVYVKLLYDELGVQNMIVYNSLLTEFTTSQTQLNWLLTQTVPVRLIKLAPNQTPNYQTVIDYPEKTLELTSAKTVTYKLFVNKDKEPTITRKYNKYERVRWWPTIGIAYIPRNRSGAVFDSTSQQFKTGNNFDNFEALVGVKFYPWRTNPARDHTTKRLIRKTFSWRYNAERGNAFRNTLFFTFGLGVRHQFLRNYYAGVGGDIVSGLSWTAGANFIFQKRYELENGMIKNQYERPQSFLYVGLCIDPGIITNLASIFK